MSLLSGILYTSTEEGWAIRAFWKPAGSMPARAQRLSKQTVKAVSRLINQSTGIKFLVVGSVADAPKSGLLKASALHSGNTTRLICC